MADDTTKTRPQDAQRVNVHEDYDVAYWSEKFGTTPERLKAAVRKVGVMADDVEAEPKRPAALLAAAMGAGLGIAVLAYSRRRRSRWDRAKDQASHLIDAAREEMKPWMSVAAGTAAASAALALYVRNRRESGWQRAGKRVGEIASHIGADRPWANLAATAAIGLASVAYTSKARRRTIRGIDESTADKINTLIEKGLQVLRRVRSISDEAGKLYPRVRRAMT